jgi:CO/xanthine dehydrogenase Mo-binding subunit
LRVRAARDDHYQVLRMSDLPEIHTKIVVTDNTPAGMGEIGVVSVAPAIGNAISRALGTRVFEQPFSRDRIWRAANGS